MRLSRYFLPVLKEPPAEAEIVSHKLMLRAGMVQQLSAGIYDWLPLGLRVLRKVEAIQRQEERVREQEAINGPADSGGSPARGAGLSASGQG